MKAMKAIYIAAAVIAPLALTGCADEEHVDATANRTGITSLTAYFTSGPNIDKAAVKYQPTGDATQTDYVIPVPYYYPEESDNTTEEYMTKMKVVAKVENNCTIDPPITVLDLTQKNHFTYTNPYGEKQDITISGQLTRSDKCQLKAITVQPGDLTGIIDEDAKTVSLVTAADLSAATATATLSAHATISPDPSQPRDMNSGAEFTVTADNGTSKAVYKVMKQVPPKKSSGYRAGSETKVFENDMTTIAGIDWNNSHPTLAATKAHVILDPGTGATPYYFSKTTGQQIGQITLGQAKATGCVTSDDKGNVLICNLAANGQKLNIYKTNDATKAPELFIAYDNNLGVDIGARLQVYGDLNGDAVVTATPLSCQNAIRWIVKDGKVGQPENILLSTAAWGGLDNVVKVSSLDATGQAGALFSGYYDGNCPVYYVQGWTTAKQVMQDGTGNAWGFNPGATDVRRFNGVNYLAICEIGYWPDWGLSGHVYFYDASSPGSLSGNFSDSSALQFALNVSDLFGSTSYPGDSRFADVLMAPSEDGYFMNIYYVSNTHKSFGCWQIDCIDK